MSLTGDESLQIVLQCIPNRGLLVCHLRYAAVGSSLMLTMMLNAVSIHFAPVFRYFSTGWRLRCCKPHSQRQLNEWILGPEFHISIRYAQTMNTVR